MTNVTGAAQPFAAQDMGQIKMSLDGIQLSSDKVAKSLTGAFTKAVESGKSFDQTLQAITQSLAKMVINAGMQPVQQGLSALLSTALSGIGGGGGGGAQSITPFADGGIVAKPTFFGSNGGAGLMGERGAEAIIPLSRGPDGRLGLAASSSSGSQVINVSISTPDVQGFQQSQVQIASALAKAVAQGQRGL